MKTTHARLRCRICAARGVRRMIAGGSSWGSHMAMHVRRGEAIRIGGVTVDPMDLPDDELPWSYVQTHRPDLREKLRATPENDADRKQREDEARWRSQIDG